MTTDELNAFDKIITIKSNYILELKKAIETLYVENSLGYHDITIADLKNKTLHLERLVTSLYTAKDNNVPLDTIRKMAYKNEKPPYIIKKPHDILLDDYLQLLDSCERLALDLMEYKKRSRK